MPSSLIPERPLLISPTLAATIGLEEAVMLHVISELTLQHTPVHRKQRKWIELNQSSLLNALPFWELEKVKSIQHNLLEKGLILIEPLPGKRDALLIAINQAEDSAQASPTPVHAPTVQPTSPVQPERSVFDQRSKGQTSYIPNNWIPGDMLYQQCQQQHQIPRSFIEQRVKTFVMFQQERRNTQYSWHNTFLKWVLKEWRQEQSYKSGKELESNMNAQWLPSQDALSILQHADISLSFIEDSVPEFVLFWRERGLVTSTWNTKFIAHVRRQWAKFTAGIDHDSQPRPVPKDFTPSVTCYEVLTLANIDQEFAKAQIQEFILYWQDRGEVASSWNTRFLQHVKYKWGSRLQNDLPAGQQIESTVQRMTDRSWAD